MTTLWKSVRKSRELERAISTIDEYVEVLNTIYYQGNAYLGEQGIQNWNGAPVEKIADEFVSYVRQVYKDNGIVFAVMAVRMSIFSSMRFCYQRMFTDGPAELFGNPSLSILEHPELGQTTQDLQLRIIQDADIAGNGYVAMIGGEVVRMRPDWVLVLMEPRIIPDQLDDGKGNTTRQLGWRRIGVAYFEGGLHLDRAPLLLPMSNVAHFAPQPDPEANWRGMSWLTPIIRDVMVDKQISRHKISFMENSATPSLIMKVPQEVKFNQFEVYLEKFKKDYGAPENAGKPLFVGAGADATVVGSSWRQMDLKSVQGGGETRICLAGGVPAVIVGVSEGLQGSSLNSGNYGMARRALADIRMHPLWTNWVGSVEHLMADDIRRIPNSSDGRVRLWYDVRHVPFLREDNKDAAEIMSTQMTAVRTGVDGGFRPEVVVRAVASNDLMLLARPGAHSGKLSVQLQAIDAAEDPNAENAARARELVEAVQKVYLGVGVVLTVDEARAILVQAGANLPIPAPDELSKEPEQPAITTGDDDTVDDGGGDDGGDAVGT